MGFGSYITFINRLRNVQIVIWLLYSAIESFHFLFLVLLSFCSIMFFRFLGKIGQNSILKWILWQLIDFLLYILMNGRVEIRFFEIITIKTIIIDCNLGFIGSLIGCKIVLIPFSFIRTSSLGNFFLNFTLFDFLIIFLFCLRKNLKIFNIFISRDIFKSEFSSFEFFFWGLFWIFAF